MGSHPPARGLPLKLGANSAFSEQSATTSGCQRFRSQPGYCEQTGGTGRRQAAVSRKQPGNNGLVRHPIGPRWLNHRHNFRYFPLALPFILFTLSLKRARVYFFPPKCGFLPLLCAVPAGPWRRSRAGRPWRRQSRGAAEPRDAIKTLLPRHNGGVLHAVCPGREPATRHEALIGPARPGQAWRGK